MASVSAGCVEALANERALLLAFWTVHRPPSATALALALRLLHALASTPAAAWSAAAHGGTVYLLTVLIPVIKSTDAAEAVRNAAAPGPCPPPHFSRRPARALPPPLRSPGTLSSLQRPVVMVRYNEWLLRCAGGSGDGARCSGHPAESTYGAAPAWAPHHPTALETSAPGAGRGHTGAE
jgi:hypothetical protein